MKHILFVPARKFSLIALIAILLMPSFSIPVNAGENDNPSSDRYFEIAKNLELFATLYRELNSYYVDDIDPNQLIGIGIEQMLASLDPYTNYITGADIDEYQLQMTGKYGGIGSRIGQIDGKIVITDPYEGAPAQKSGLMAGDQIIAVDGVVATNKNSDEISQLLRGQPGTPISIKVLRPVTNEELTFNITRAEISLSNVPYYGMISPEYGYIKLDQFTEEAGKNVGDALKKLKENPNLKGVILDLRDNPGGLLNEAVSVSNVFIDKGAEIVSTKGKVAEANKSYSTDQKAIDVNIPLIVLTSGGSASASEIVSGSIQDLDRGVVLGQRTYGKGLVQITRPLAYKSKLKVTTSKYYIPSGRCIQAIDYSSKSEDGKAPVIPDSLRKEFKTLGGRIVKDGAGIEPDVTVETDNFAPVTIALLSKFHVFNYATIYRQKHPELTSLDNFKLTDADFNDFVAYLSNKDYDYVTESEEKLNELLTTVKDESYYEALSGVLKELESKMKHDKEQDLQKHKAEILTLLETEIASRYKYDKGRIEVALRHDLDIKKAIEILSNSEAYKKILSANK